MDKQCSKCKITKDVHEFRSEKRTRDGYQARCLACEHAYQAEWRKRPASIKNRAEQHQRRKQANLLKNADDESLDKTKFCPTCRIIKENVFFPRAFGRRGGLATSCKPCQRVRASKYTAFLRNQVYNLLGHICRRCSFSDKRALQIDHVNGGGNKEHAIIKNPVKFLKKVIAEAALGEYQILCANCNWIKRSERDENPITIKNKAVAA